QVWGESCLGKMHFDCGSFVRYCFRTTLGPGLVTPGIRMRDVAPSVWSSDSGKKLADVDVLPADIVYAGEEHVGLATGNQEYLKAENGAAGITAGDTVHAWFARMGIVKTSLASPRPGQPTWTEIRRWQKWS
ncbi:MAG TPA: NlpC/P60 family protein, partial [Acidobacteriaceae bacterium]|nr:NlpC/P60 family protein [Acidobacteriaceae bacterium]